MRYQTIAQIHKRFRRRPEWLLIVVGRMDEATTTPLTGKVIAHHPNRDEIYKKSLKYRGKGLLFIDHPQEKLPEGYAVAFCAP